MRTNKSQLSVRFVVTLIIGILLAWSIWSVVGLVFRLTDQSQESYFEFVAALKKADRNLDSYPLRLDKKTAIVFFNSGEDRASITAPTGGYGFSTYTILKPEECPQDQSCVCLCQRLNSEEEGVLCERSRCDNLCENTKCDKEHTVTFYGNCGEEQKRKCEPGIIFGRGIFAFMDVPYPTVVWFKKEGTKTIGVYLMNPEEF